jgi:hypothetical protein
VIRWTEPKQSPKRWDDGHMRAEMRYLELFLGLTKLTATPETYGEINPLPKPRPHSQKHSYPAQVPSRPSLVKQASLLSLARLAKLAAQLAWLELV